MYHSFNRMVSAGQNQLRQSRAVQIGVTLIVLLVLVLYAVIRVKHAVYSSRSLLPNNEIAQVQDGGTAQEYFEAGLNLYWRAKRREADPMFGNELYLPHAKAALENFDKAVQLDPEFAEARLYRARSAAMVGMDAQSVLSDIDKAASLKFGYAEAWYDRALVLFQMNMQAEGKQSLDRAIELKPDFFEALVMRGIARKNEKSWKDALTDFTNAKTAMPEHVTPKDAFILYLHRGYVLYILQNFQDAISDLSEAIRIEPNDAFAYTVRGNVYLMTGDIKSMVQDFDQALRLNSLFAGDIQEYLSTLNSLLAKLDPESQEYSLLKALIEKGTNYKPQA